MTRSGACLEDRRAQHYANGMTDAQRRRIALGIILTALGLIVGNIGLQGVLRDPTSNAANGYGIFAGAALLAVGVYLIARFLILRSRGEQSED